MLALAVIAVIMGNPSLETLPVMQAPESTTPVFPVLFTTIACGAISGFHSLVGSGTTSKQLDKEKDAKPIAYGGMLIECVLALLTLCAVAHAYSFAGTDLAFNGATAIFGGGIASMIDPSRGTVYSVLYTLLVLTYSTFCLTSLDTATRLGRFMFQEFWIDASKGETPDNVTGYKKVLANPYVATVITVFLGIMLGMNGYAKIWALFGSANQLLAALALLAIAAWLGNVGKKNAMCWIPMFFMLAVTIASLCINTKTQIGLIQAGGADWGPYVQAVVGALLVVLALVLAVEGVQTIFGKKKAKA
jgi:carbon starvation protein